MNRFITNFLEYPNNLMTFYSIHAINEYGYHKPCQRDLGDYADFVVMNSNISHLSGFSRMGFCLPKECKQKDYDSYSAKMVSLVDFAFAHFPDVGIVMNNSLFQPWTRVGLSMIKSEEYTEDWHQRTAAGFYPTLILIILILILAISASLYTYIKRKLSKRQQIQTFMMVDTRQSDIQNSNQDYSYLQNNMDHSSSNIREQQTQMNTQLLLRDSSNQQETRQQLALNFSNQRSTIRTLGNGENDLMRTALSDSQERDSQAQVQQDTQQSQEQKQGESKLSQILEKISAQSAFVDLQAGYCKDWDNKELDVINAMKFFQQFLIIVTCTASYLILGAALNPWSMQVFSSNPLFAMIVAGVIALDVYFTFSAFFGFYRMCQIYDAQKGFTFKDVMKIYGKRLIRLLPIYYLTLLFGIFIGPRISSGPTWYMYEQSLFYRCNTYWWTNVILISNFIPWDQDNKGGCMPWSWSICVDFQLYIFIPLYVYAFKQSRLAGLIIGWAYVAAGMFVVGFLAHTKSYTANVYTLENYDMYQLLTTKPWSKFHLHGLGILCAILYFDILAFRKLDKFEQKKQYPKIYFFSNNIISGKIIMLSGVGFIVTNFFVTYEPTQDAHNWNNAGNTTYLVLSKITFAMGWMMLAFYIFLGHSKLGRNALGNPLFNALGKLVYLAYLTAPIIMMIVYSNDQRGTFMTFVGNAYLGIGHIFVTFIAGVLIYILVEYQLKKLCEIYIVIPYLSHDHIIRKVFEENKEDKQSDKKQQEEDELLKKRIAAKLS
ncbi:UNKNOWN [Stylonychia lemnae]|uniref:Acyltransferase 3 domain-containing protein n=1 Tax=Stylonychia lemnae TaxID=5949 RepID=A0A078B497_STYLE|nr:UNKNOWN [Stylonychia lemnae]|eukprot:CDW89299.1 UNKNOWN [Stylonychia lemnae]